MTTPDFEDYVREYEAAGVGQLLYALIHSVVARIVVRYPPEVYASNRVWDDDEVYGLCHDFIMEKELKLGWLEHHLLTQDTVGGLTKAIRRDFRHLLVSRRRRSECSNLFGRVKSILCDDARFEPSDSGETIWGLAEWTSRNCAQRLDVVVDAMFSVALPPLVRYRPDSKKCSHLLSTHDLGHLLELTFRIIDKCISLQLLMDALRYRLNLLDAMLISLDDSVGSSDAAGQSTRGDFVPSLDDPEAEVISKEIAEDIFAALTDRQREVLSLLFLLSDAKLVAIAEHIGASKSTVHNDLKAIAQQIASTGLELQEAETAFAYLKKVCADRSVESDRSEGND